MRFNQCGFKNRADIFSAIIFFKLGFTLCETEQPLQGMELQEKEGKKDEKDI